MASIMARPMRRILPLPSRLAVTIPPVYRRGYETQTESAPRRPRTHHKPARRPKGTWLGKDAAPRTNGLTKEPDHPGRKSIPEKLGLEEPLLEQPLPLGVRLTRTYITLLLQRQQMSVLHTTLRDACKCSICVDPHSKQRNFRTTDIPLNVQPRKVEASNDELTIQWRNDIPGYDESHTSTYKLDEFINPVKAVMRGVHEARLRTVWDKGYMEKSQHWISYEDYIADGKPFTEAMLALGDTGLLFIKDIPDSREEIEKLATRIGPLKNTFYGPTWDVKKVPEAKNVAYTSQHLGFHMDLLYVRDPPGYQLLHCLENSCDGGESMFADTFRAAQIMYNTRPDYFKLLSEARINYEYNHGYAIYHNNWPVFDTINADHYRGKGMPAIKNVNYSPPFQGPIYTQPSHRDFLDHKHFRDALIYFESLLESENGMFELKLQPGQAVVFENRRIVHARRKFNTNTGSRWLAGAYVDMDAGLSTIRKLRRDYPEVKANYFEKVRNGGTSSVSETSHKGREEQQA